MFGKQTRLEELLQLDGVFPLHPTSMIPPLPVSFFLLGQCDWNCPVWYQASLLRL